MIHALLQGMKTQDVTANAYVTDAESIRAPKIALLRSRGPVCWDAAFYLDHNPDLPQGGVSTAAQAWDHYLGNGQFEGRASRYVTTCAFTFAALDTLLFYRQTDWGMALLVLLALPGCARTQ